MCACCPGLIINRTSFLFQEHLVWTLNDSKGSTTLQLFVADVVLRRQSLPPPLSLPPSSWAQANGLAAASQAAGTMDRHQQAWSQQKLSVKSQTINILGSSSHKSLSQPNSKSSQRQHASKGVAVLQKGPVSTKTAAG